MYVRGTTLVTSSPILTNSAPNLPGGVKAVPQQDAATMSVQWQTRDAGQPQVVWGASAEALLNVAAAATTTYTKADVVSACTQGQLTSPLSGMIATLQGWTDPGAIHRALLTGLQPNTTYYYQVGYRWYCWYCW